MTLADLTPDPANARKHAPRNVGTIVSALHEVGAARSIVIDEDGVILAGNATVEAAAEAGITRVQVVEADGQTIVAVRRRGLTPEQKARLALFDNRAAELADGWDVGVLTQMQADGVSLEGLWHPDELAKLLGSEPKDGKTDPEDVPAERPTSIKLGDLFEMGKHRLLCGDCTKPEDVARLMGKDRAGLMNTDPPYGIAYVNDDLHPDAGPIRGKVKNDDKIGAAIQPFLEAAFLAAKSHAIKLDAAWYLWHGMLTQGFFAAAAAAAAAVILM